MRKCVGNAHVSAYGDAFSDAVQYYTEQVSGPGRELEFHYAQSIQPDGRALFSALIIVYEDAQT